MPATAKQVRFEVRWCSSIPKDEFGDSDMDNAVYEAEYFKTEVGAVRRARKILEAKMDAFGCVEITEEHPRPHSLMPWRMAWHQIREQYIDSPTATKWDWRSIKDGETNDFV